MRRRRAATWMAIAGAWGFVAVALGAFGAHALRGRLTGQQEGWWDLAARYHLVHAVALLAAGVVVEWEQRATAAAWAFLVGSAVFSGTLYVMAAGGPRWLGAVTPLGGLTLLAGWALLAVAAWRSRTGTAD